MTADVTRLLDEMQARADAATEGPWEADDTEVSQHWSGPEPWKTVASNEVVCMPYCYGGSGRGVERKEDAEFIAAARQDLPRLIAAVRAVLDRACIEQDDAESAMTYAAEINDGLMLASQQARKQAWTDAARAITTALEAS